ncbi:MAG: cyclic dehypoxanthinyl futalosine synthase [Myxococcota bacterium]
MTTPLRICTVSFLNARPLYWSLFDRPPVGDDGQPLFTVQEALPAECARRLAADECDVALVPVASYLEHPEWEVVPEIAIAARGAVQTVVVLSQVPLREVTTIHLDAASRSSVLLLRTLLASEGLSPTLVTAPHGEGAGRVQGTEAALVIGDAAFDPPGDFAHRIDLGTQWLTLTGMPMVFAFWAAQPGRLTEAHVAALHTARDRGLKYAEEIAGRYRRKKLEAGAPVLDENFYANYLRRTIRYRLDAWEREGLVEYIARSHELGLHDAGDVHVRFAAREHQDVAAARRDRPRAQALDVDALLARAAAGERLSLAEGIVLYEQADTLALGDAADRRRQALHPDGVVTYIIDRNVNYTNVCTARCKFCNFYVPPTRKTQEGYVHSKEVLGQKFRETEALGGVQILLQGGLNPDLGLAWYEDLFRWTKQNFRLKLHALSPTEIIHIAHLEDLSVREVLVRLRAAGMDSLPGGGAEMLHDEVRNRISPFKNTTDEWLDVMRQAHALGMRSTCTMVFGFQETAEHTLVHLHRLRQVQDEALARGGQGRFTAFIAWPFQAAGTRLKLRDDTSAWRYLRTQALSRLYLDNIDNIQVSWPTLGPAIGEVALRFGANDFGSVMIEENVVSQAGAHFMLTAEQIEHHVRAAGFTPRRRNMQYQLLPEVAA